MNIKTAKTDSERFQSGAKQYADYLETPEGRLRSDLSFANLEEFLPPPPAAGSLLALDLGGGTGAAAVRLAQRGIQVTLLDSSTEMLDMAQYAAREAGVTAKLIFKHGDAAQLATLFNAEAFDVILCHNVLEYVDDPGAVLRDAAPLLRDSSSLLSTVVRNQAGEVLKAAIQSGDLAAAESNLTAEWGQESLYGGKVRLFTKRSVEDMLSSASLAIAATRGVRVVADYLPPKISRSDDYQQIFHLERKLGSRQEFVAVARYMQHLARRADLRV
jgi:S-adenosylmethionine-dependent methyltransferase